MSDSDKKKITKLTVTKKYSDVDMKKIKGSFHNDWSYLINYDCDAFDSYGNLLFKFRKNVFPKPILKQGYHSFKKSIVKKQALNRYVAQKGILKWLSI